MENKAEIVQTHIVVAFNTDVWTDKFCYFVSITTHYIQESKLFFPSFNCVQI